MADASFRFIGPFAKRSRRPAYDRTERPQVSRKSDSDHGPEQIEETGEQAKVVRSTPMLLPRIRRPGSIRPFTFMTTRYLEPSGTPGGPRSELVPFISKDDTAGRDPLIDLPG
jgi:hypothetical protein